jgi:putative tryptophan/tyrosine transport system substrate-binding protein
MGQDVRRREVIACLSAAGLWPFAARAQQPSKLKRVAIMDPVAPPAAVSIAGNPGYTIFFEEMKHLGYVEGRNLIVERYCLEGRLNRFPEVVHEVVVTRPDVILAITPYLTLALKSETHTIPIVAWTSDPIAAGIVSSLARPGGNVTGVSPDAGAGVGGKVIELLGEAVGKLSNVRMLQTAANREAAVVKTAREAAEKMNIPFRLELLQSPISEAEYRRAFDAMQRGHEQTELKEPTRRESPRLRLGPTPTPTPTSFAHYARYS